METTAPKLIEEEAVELIEEEMARNEENEEEDEIDGFVYDI